MTTNDDIHKVRFCPASKYQLELVCRAISRRAGAPRVGAVGREPSLAAQSGGRMKAKPRTKKPLAKKPKAAKAPAKRAAAKPAAKAVPDKKKAQAQKPAAKQAKVAVKEPAPKEPALVMAPTDGKPLPQPDPDAGMMAGVKMATIPVMADIERKPMPPRPTPKKQVSRKLEPPTKSNLGKMTYTFEEGGAAMRELLGGKGAGLSEMTRIGLPVPPGFTITTEVCRRYIELGRQLPPGLDEEMHKRVAELERKTGKEFGGETDPLLVSVRSGARVSMPGMMDTVLNLGLNNRTCNALIVLTKNDKFAWDAYRRFVQMFATVVLGMRRDPFDEVVKRYVARARVPSESDLDRARLPQHDERVQSARPPPYEKGLPRGRLHPAAHGGRSGLQFVEQQARHRIPALRAHPRWVGHGRERVHHGLRQHGRRLGDGRGLHPQPVDGEKSLYRRVLAERAG